MKLCIEDASLLKKRKTMDLSHIARPDELLDAMWGPERMTSLETVRLHEEGPPTIEEQAACA
jgi:hypothetical protein